MPSLDPNLDLGPGVRVVVATPDGKGSVHHQDGLRWERTDAQEAADRQARRIAYFGQPRPIQEQAMSNLALYLKWLTWLSALSKNLPKFIEAALAFYDAVKDLLPEAPPTEEGGGLALTQSIDDALTAASRSPDATLAADVLEAEERIIEEAQRGKRSLAIRDGTRLRELFQFFMLLKSMFGF